MDLFDVDEMRLLLDACAKTLEVVVLYPGDPHGEEPSLKSIQILANSFAAIFSLRDFDLSRNESLRTLRFPAPFIDHTATDDLPDAHTFLKHVLSTVTSSVLLEVVQIYRDNDFLGVGSQSSEWPHLRELSRADRADEASRHHRRFEVLREVHKVRAFQLVLCAHVRGRVGEYPIRVLEEAVAEEKAKMGFDSFSSDPLVVFDPQRCHRDW